MTEATGYEAFCLYNALKLHFTSKTYDFFKYNGKTNVSKDAFMHRKDKYGFYKISRKFQPAEMRDFFVANLLDNPKAWVGDLNADSSGDVFLKWKKRTQSLSYIFTNDLSKIFYYGEKELFAVKDGQYPILLNLAMQDEISIETICILNDIMNFFPAWKKKIDDDIIWPEFANRCLKYTPFINYDKDKFTKLIVAERKSAIANSINTMI